ncbi:MFS transporter [Brevibacillus laterosporus]|nr:MFS transporter [Brevibacillus laterosporus]TPG71049.1 MFS transporter [Brevibacillus laterosporus]
MTSEGKQPIVILSLITALCLLGDSMLYIVLPVHFSEVGLTSLAQVGLLLSVNRLVRLPLSPFINWLYQKVDREICLLGAVSLAVLTTASYGFLHSFWMWIIIRSLWGLVWGILRLGAYLTIVDIATDKNRGQLTGTYNGLYRLGSLFGMLLGGWLAGQFGMQFTALLFAVGTLCGIPYILRVISTKPKLVASDRSSNASPSSESSNTTKSPEAPVTYTQQSADGMPDVKSIWKNRQMWFSLLTGALIAMLFQGIFSGGVSQLLAYYYSEPLLLAGLTLGAATLAGFLQAMRWIWEPWLAPWIGRVSDGKWGRRQLLWSSLFCTAICLFFIPIEKSLCWMIVVLLLVQLLATALTTLSDTHASDIAAIHSQHKGTILTAYTMAVDLGAALGPLIGLSVIQLWSPLPLYWGACLVIFLLSITWYLTKEKRLDTSDHIKKTCR